MFFWEGLLFIGGGGLCLCIGILRFVCDKLEGVIFVSCCEFIFDWYFMVDDMFSWICLGLFFDL